MRVRIFVATSQDRLLSRRTDWSKLATGNAPPGFIVKLGSQAHVHAVYSRKTSPIVL